MNSLVLSIGSNTEECNVQKALTWLSGFLTAFHASSCYITPAVKSSGNNYSNAVVKGCTPMSLEELEKTLKDYELENGRTASARIKGAVSIDLDVVVWNDEIMREWDFNQRFFQTGYNQLSV